MKVDNLALITFAVLFCLVAKPALGGVDIHGAKFSATGDPGNYIDHPMVISIDETDSPKNFSVQIMDFGQSLKGANMPLKPEDDFLQYSARPFLELDMTELHLEPGESKTVNISGKVPDDVGEGGRYAIVTISSISSGGGSIGISIGFEVPVLLTINGTDLIHTGEITDIDVGELDSGIGKEVRVIFQNTGNYHYKAKAEAILEDERGNKLAEASTPLSFSSIIPPNTREFKLTLEPNAKLEPGTYVIKTRVSLNDDTVLASEDLAFKI